MADRLELFQRTLETYRKHGWQLREVLATPETRALLTEDLLGSVPVREFALDAMWFARRARGGVEAWELRLVSETPYALFEAFHEDDTEEQRRERRRELENELRARCADKGTRMEDNGRRSSRS
ncbi:MAG: hypothetical protein C4334_10115 [Pyrinomonas sp.]|uniref:hypothetical protein n=1 Tax=Pyrinomonas sp. TaxID=2080306 RepID=UPI00331F7042